MDSEEEDSVAEELRRIRRYGFRKKWTQYQWTQTMWIQEVIDAGGLDGKDWIQQSLSVACHVQIDVTDDLSLIVSV